MQRLLPPTLVASLLTLMVAGWFAWPWPTVPWFIRSTGIAAVAAGLLITMRHARLFEIVGTNIKTFDDPNTLVVDGAFRWSRNPMYLGFIVLLVGVALLLGSAITLAGPVVFFVAADRWYIPFEERRMASIFGNDYDVYRQSVPRWIGLSRQ